VKKLLPIFLVLVLSVVGLVGCQETSEPANNTPAPAPAPAPVEEKPVVEDGIAKLGLGHLTSIAKSKDLNGDVLPVAQVDTTFIGAGFDKNGKVVKVQIDHAQQKINFDKDLQITTDLKAPQVTKIELGDGYGMIAASSIGKNWHEQIPELEKWMIGKTIEEIKAMKTVERDASHPAVPDEADLTSLVTITVEGYIAAIEEAYNNAVEIPAGATTLGLGHEISLAKSKSLDAAKNVLPAAQVDTVLTVSAFDKDGKVVRTIIDTAQTKVSFDANGKITTDKAGEFKTKIELGDEYGMIAASSIGKNWYQQIAELEKWMAGKKVDEIKAMKTIERDASHPAVPDVAELASLVTVTVQDYIKVVAESFDNAK